MEPNGSNNYLAASYEDALKENARLRAELGKTREALDGLLAHCASQGWWLKSHAVKVMDAANAALAPAASGEKISDAGIRDADEYFGKELRVYPAPAVKEKQNG